MRFRSRLFPVGPPSDRSASWSGGGTSATLRSPTKRPLSPVFHPGFHSYLIPSWAKEPPSNVASLVSASVGLQNRSQTEPKPPLVPHSGLGPDCSRLASLGSLRSDCRVAEQAPPCRPSVPIHPSPEEPSPLSLLHSFLIRRHRGRDPFRLRADLHSWSPPQSAFRTAHKLKHQSFLLLVQIVPGWPPSDRIRSDCRVAEQRHLEVRQASSHPVAHRPRTLSLLHSYLISQTPGRGLLVSRCEPSLHGLPLSRPFETAHKLNSILQSYLLADSAQIVPGWPPSDRSAQIVGRRNKRRGRSESPRST